MFIGIPRNESLPFTCDRSPKREQKPGLTSFGFSFRFSRVPNCILPLVYFNAVRWICCAAHSFRHGQCYPKWGAAVLHLPGVKQCFNRRSIFFFYFFLNSGKESIDNILSHQKRTTGFNTCLKCECEASMIVHLNIKHLVESYVTWDTPVVFSRLRFMTVRMKRTVVEMLKYGTPL